MIVHPNGVIFDPKTSIWGSRGVLGGDFGDPEAHFGDPEWPRPPLEGQKRKLHRFTATTRRVPFGGHFGVILVTFSDFVVLK